MVHLIGIAIGITLLVIFGLSIGGILWEEGVIPPWLTTLFLMPAAFMLDYFVKDEPNRSQFTKYSTILGVLLATFIGYVLLEFFGLPLEVAFVIVFFLLLLFLAPIVFLLPIPPIWFS